MSAAKPTQRKAPAWAADAVIQYRDLPGGIWCDLGPDERLRADFEGVYRLAPGVFPVIKEAPPQRVACWGDQTGPLESRDGF